MRHGFITKQRTDGLWDLVGPDGEAWTSGVDRGMVHTLANRFNKAFESGYEAAQKEMHGTPEKSGLPF